MLPKKIINSLIDSAPLTLDEEDYLDILGTLVYEYEQKQEPVPDIYGVDLLKVLIEENELLQKDLLPIFKTESIISAILKKRRKLTTRHIEELADFFSYITSCFFSQIVLNNLCCYLKKAGIYSP